MYRVFHRADVYFPDCFLIASDCKNLTCFYSYPLMIFFWLFPGCILLQKSIVFSFVPIYIFLIVSWLHVTVKIHRVFHRTDLWYFLIVSWLHLIAIIYHVFHRDDLWYFLYFFLIADGFKNFHCADLGYWLHRFWLQRSFILLN